MQGAAAGYADTVPADDRSFRYGDGLFETMLAVDGRIAFLPLHLDRLLEGARRLHIAIDDANLRAALGDLPASGAHALRLTVSRGSGGPGYRPKSDAVPRLRLTSRPLEHDVRSALPPVALVRSRIVLAEQPALAGIKHCNRLEQVLAAIEATQDGAGEALMLNRAGGVQCATAANVFVLEGDRLYTPPCDGAGVAGTRRRLLLESLARRVGLETQEQPLTPARCREGDALLLTSALIGIRAVASFEGREFPDHAIVAKLQAAYRAELEACVGG